MKIYNTLTREKEELKPVKKGRISMYVCGPTVYDEPHIGHARSAYIFDVMRRYLEYRYRDDKVIFVRNITDVDDKIINRAKKDLETESQKVTIKEKTIEISNKYLKAYHKDMDILGIKKLDKNNEPRAIAYIPKMVKFIELLIKKECAYEADGDVYFDIKKAKNYGKLSNQNIEKMEIAARIASGEKKRDPLDFALWKRAKEDEPSWNSPWGKGRPGWHVECSVMSSDILGDEFDIHGGGIDLVFPHHENEIAQSEGAGKKFARYWVHNGLLTINGEKMSKSLGNFITIGDFKKKYGDMDILRLFFLSTHYSHAVDYSEQKIEQAKAAKSTLEEFKDFKAFFWMTNRAVSVKRLRPDFGEQQLKSDSKKFRKVIDACKKEFMDTMDDNFNTPEALAALFKLRNFAWRHVNPLKAEIRDLEYAKSTIIELGHILGLFLEHEEVDVDPGLRMHVEEKIKERDEARKSKNFKKADQIREELLKKDIIVEDTEGGTAWRRKV